MDYFRNMAVRLLALLVVGCSPASTTEEGVAASPPALIDASTPERSLRTFIAPGGHGHFAQPAGVGTLKICRSSENSERGAVSIPAGTNFADAGTMAQPPEVSGGWWLLQVQTTEAVALAESLDCVTVAARVVPTEIPANYSDMQSLTRFSASDRRYFEILASGDELDRVPELLLLNATAQTNFQ